MIGVGISVRVSVAAKRNDRSEIIDAGRFEEYEVTVVGNQFIEVTHSSSARPEKSTRS